ncbi:MAG: hypothetical protein SGPRY_002463 [Prymnesium sp.]
MRVTEGAELFLDNLECTMQRYSECRDFKKLCPGPGSLCAEEMRDPGQGELAQKVYYESYEKVSYHTKDGTEQVKKDFVSKSVPFSEFRQSLTKYWPKFVAHQNGAKWQDFAAMKSRPLVGKAAMVIDYAENYSPQPRYEHQSKYFSQIQTTIIPIVLMFRVEDLTNISEEERADFCRLFDELQMPLVIHETHSVISSDMMHDNARVQNVRIVHATSRVARLRFTRTCEKQTS